MNWSQALLTVVIVTSVTGMSLKCGEDIVVHRGEKKVLRFWSGENELLNVDVLPKTEEGENEGEGEGDDDGGGEGDDRGGGRGGEGGGGGGLRVNTNEIDGGSGGVSSGNNVDIGGLSSAMAFESQKLRTDVEESDDGDLNSGNDQENNNLYYSHTSLDSSGNVENVLERDESSQHQSGDTYNNVQGTAVSLNKASDSKHPNDRLGVNTVILEDSIIYDYKTVDDYDDYDELSPELDDTHQNIPVLMTSHNDERETTKDITTLRPHQELEQEKVITQTEDHQKEPNERDPQPESTKPIEEMQSVPEMTTLRSLTQQQQEGAERIEEETNSTESQSYKTTTLSPQDFQTEELKINQQRNEAVNEDSAGIISILTEDVDTMVEELESPTTEYSETVINGNLVKITSDHISSDHILDIHGLTQKDVSDTPTTENSLEDSTQPLILQETSKYNEADSELTTVQTVPTIPSIRGSELSTDSFTETTEGSTTERLFILETTEQAVASQEADQQLQQKESTTDIPTQATDAVTTEWMIIQSQGIRKGTESPSTTEIPSEIPLTTIITDVTQSISSDTHLTIDLHNIIEFLRPSSQQKTQYPGVTSLDADKDETTEKDTYISSKVSLTNNEDVFNEININYNLRQEDLDNESMNQESNGSTGHKDVHSSTEVNNESDVSFTTVISPLTIDSVEDTKRTDAYEYTDDLTTQNILETTTDDDGVTEAVTVTNMENKLSISREGEGQASVSSDKTAIDHDDIQESDMETQEISTKTTDMDSQESSLTTTEEIREQDVTTENTVQNQNENQAYGITKESNQQEVEHLQDATVIPNDVTSLFHSGLHVADFMPHLSETENDNSDNNYDINSKYENGDGDDVDGIMSDIDITTTTKSVVGHYVNDGEKISFDDTVSSTVLTTRGDNEDYGSTTESNHVSDFIENPNRNEQNESDWEATTLLPELTTFVFEFDNIQDLINDTDIETTTIEENVGETTTKESEGETTTFSSLDSDNSSIPGIGDITDSYGDIFAGIVNSLNEVLGNISIGVFESSGNLPIDVKDFIDVHGNLTDESNNFLPNLTSAQLPMEHRDPSLLSRNELVSDEEGDVTTEELSSDPWLNPDILAMGGFMDLGMTMIAEETTITTPKSSEVQDTQTKTLIETQEISQSDFPYETSTLMLTQMTEEISTTELPSVTTEMSRDTTLEALSNHSAEDTEGMQTIDAEMTTEASVEEYQFVINDDAFKGSEYYEDLVDSLQVMDSPYQSIGEVTKKYDAKGQDEQPTLSLVHFTDVTDTPDTSVEAFNVPTEILRIETEAFNMPAETFDTLKEAPNYDTDSEIQVKDSAIFAEISTVQTEASNVATKDINISTEESSIPTSTSDILTEALNVEAESSSTEKTNIFNDTTEPLNITASFSYPDLEATSDGFLTTLGPVRKQTLLSNENIEKTTVASMANTSNMEVNSKDDYDKEHINKTSSEETNDIHNSSQNDDINTETTAASESKENTKTAFTVPLVILRNQEMLSELLKTQHMNSDSKVVIKEQGSKVTINTPNKYGAQISTTESHTSETTGPSQVIIGATTPLQPSLVTTVKTGQQSLIQVQDTTLTPMNIRTSPAVVLSDAVNLDIESTEGVTASVAQVATDEEKEAEHGSVTKEGSGASSVVSSVDASDYSKPSIASTKHSSLSAESESFLTEKEKVVDVTLVTSQPESSLTDATELSWNIPDLKNKMEELEEFKDQRDEDSAVHKESIPTSQTQTTLFLNINSTDPDIKEPISSPVQMELSPDGQNIEATTVMISTAIGQSEGNMLTNAESNDATKFETETHQKTTTIKPDVVTAISDSELATILIPSSFVEYLADEIKLHQDEILEEKYSHERPVMSTEEHFVNSDVIHAQILPHKNHENIESEGTAPQGQPHTIYRGQIPNSEELHIQGRPQNQGDTNIHDDFYTQETSENFRDSEGVLTQDKPQNYGEIKDDKEELFAQREPENYGDTGEKDFEEKAQDYDDVTAAENLYAQEGPQNFWERKDTEELLGQMDSEGYGDVSETDGSHTQERPVTYGGTEEFYGEENYENNGDTGDQKRQENNGSTNEIYTQEQLDTFGQLSDHHELHGQEKPENYGEVRDTVNLHLQSKPEIYGDEESYDQERPHVNFDGELPGSFSRKDDEGYADYGGDSPFFIRLPGSPDVVPVYIQYEPVEIKYVPKEDLESEINDDYGDVGLPENTGLPIHGLFEDNTEQGRPQQRTEEEVNEILAASNPTSNEGYASSLETRTTTAMSTAFVTPNVTSVTAEPDGSTNQELEGKTAAPDDSSNSLFNGIYRILDDVAGAVSNQFSKQKDENENENDEFKPNKPIVRRPDPFFLMEAPQLGNQNHQPQETSHKPSNNDAYSTVRVQENDDEYSVDVSSQLGFEGEPGMPQEKKGIVEDVPLGVKQEVLYPGDFYTHDVYTGVNLTSLINPVFELNMKTTPPSEEHRMNPQYTPFPITTNPPRFKTTSPSSTISPSVTATTQLPSSSSPPPKRENSQTVSGVEISEITTKGVEERTSEATTIKTTPSEQLPSVEYSPIPAVDFDHSFDSISIFGELYGKEDSILGKYPNPFAWYPGAHQEAPHTTDEDSTPDATINEVSAAPFKLTDETQTTTTVTTTSPTTATSTSDARAEATNEEVINPDENLVISSDQFMAHEQAWSLPQSREEPGGAGLQLGGPSRDSPGRVYSAFYSPLDVPGIDPTAFSYRKIPQIALPVGTNHRYNTPLVDPIPVQHPSRVQQGQVESAQRETNITNSTTLIQGGQGGQDPPVSDAANHMLLGPQFYQYLNNLPYALLRNFLDPSVADSQKRPRREAQATGEQVFCEWNIKTERGLYLLLTFHNLSAAYTLDCHGAYIEVERENNGYDARWCGNRVLQAGSRPHVIFAKSEVRITVYDDGDHNKALPTGFEADIEVIDLFDARDYTSFMRSNAYPHIRRLLLG